MASDDPTDDDPKGHEAGVPPRDPSSGRFKRRVPSVIDATATDVTPPEAVSPAAAEPERAARPDEPETPTVAEIAGAEAPADGAAPPPQPEQPARRPMGLFAVLIAALLSGLIGGAFAFAVASSFYGAAENIDAITDVEARVVDLRQRIESLEARQATAPPADVGPLKAQIATLEAKITAVETAATSAPPTSPELIERIAAAEALAKQANTDASRPAASPDALAALGNKVAALEQGIDAAAKAGEARARGAAQLAALGALRGAVTSSAPFDVELGAARSLLGPAGAVLEPLQASAASGLPNGPQLATRLRAAFTSDAAPAAAPGASSEPQSAAPSAAGDDSLFGRLTRGAAGLVSVKRVEDAPASGEAPPPQLGTAEAALMRGDLDAALVSLKALPEADAAKAAPVVAAIDARRSALATIATLDRQVLAGLGATP